MDNLGGARAINAAAYAQAADFASATSAEVYDLFAGCNPRSHTITEGYDPQTYFPEVMEKKHDVIFVGHATPQRVADLREIMSTIPVTIFGGGWPESFHAAAPVFNDDLRRLINQSRIVLNFVHSNIFSDRIILSAAAGGFVLTQYCPDLETYFQAGQHLDWFRTPREAVAKIRHYLQQAEARERIAQQGMAEVRARFSWPVVCQRILETTASGSRAAAPAQVLDHERVLFVSWHGLGDNVMLTPALRKYREQYPNRHVAVAGLQRFGNTLVQLLSGLPFVDEVLPCLPDAWNDFSDYQTGVSAVLAQGQKIAREKGFHRIIVLPTKRQDGYRLHKVFRFADEVNVQLERLVELQTELSVSDAADQAAKEFLRLLPRPVIVLHATAGNNRKTLPPAEVEKLLTRFPAGTVLEFGRQSCARCVPLLETDMEMTKAIIKHADRVVAIDSVVMHMAGALRKPLTAIFSHTPIHQAIPLTYEVEVLALPKPEVQEAEYRAAKQEIAQRYPKG